MSKCDYPTGLLVKMEKNGGSMSDNAIRGMAIGYYTTTPLWVPPRCCFWA